MRLRQEDRGWEGLAGSEEQTLDCWSYGGEQGQMCVLGIKMEVHRSRRQPVLCGYGAGVRW